MAAQVPSAYQDLYNTLNTQISSFDSSVKAQWKGARSQTEWAPQLLAAGANQYTALLGTNYYQYSVAPQLQELQALGAKAVTIHADFPILYQPFYSSNPSQYQQFVNFYQQVANDVHAAGLKLVVEESVVTPFPGASGNFSSYYASLPWSEYESARAQQAVTIAQVMKPDYLSVLVEPDTEATQTTQTNVNTVSGATSLLTTILTSIKNAHVSGVMVGAGAGTWQASFPSYIQSFLGVAGLQYVDLHVYPVNNSFFMNLMTILPTIQAKHLPVAVSECWLYKVRNSELATIDITTISGRDTFSFWAPLDTAFLQAMTDFANYSNMLFLAPYWVDYFSAYLDYNSVSSLPFSQILINGEDAATTGFQTAQFTSTGHAWETMTEIAPDTTHPSTPGAPSDCGNGTDMTCLTWPLASDNVAVAGYHIYRNGAQVAQETLPPFYDSGLTPGATYTYTINAFDAAGNVSPNSGTFQVTTINNVPPTPPTSLTATSVSSSSISLSWGPSTSISPITGYRVLRGSSPTNLAYINGDVNALTFTNSPLAPNTTYYYAVAGFISNGLTSANSNVIAVTTPSH